ncbi:hypothetical protein [Agrobacterium sp. OT33]|uniref:hypothetical protein n=1 Tax=Agrobacterium sp. OT33 TaxID=2815338 RepID=UPI001A8CDE07|nr:hypothetical protein [Agrobacterium sp. OT33]MBO0125169.1 hypothetical protein [Agrobacterium sp. OT33]
MTALEEIKKAIEEIGSLKVEFTPDCDESNSIIAPINDDYDGTFFTVIGCGDKQDKLGGFMAMAVNAVPELLSTLESLQRENEELRAWIKAATTEITKAIGGGSEMFTPHGDEFRVDPAFVSSFIQYRRERHAESKKASIQKERELIARAEAAEAEVERLREALKPFAEASAWNVEGVDLTQGDRPAFPSDIDLMNLEGNSLTLCDLFDARDALAGTARYEPEPASSFVEKSPFEFDRYINGSLMAEGVRIEKVETLEKAMVIAAKVASRGPNGEVPVLIMRARQALASTGGEHNAE